MKDPLPCIVCGRENEKAMGEQSSVNQPYNATAFRTHGHYGSTVFDPMWEPEDLSITICDPCLLAAAEQGNVLLFDADDNARPWRPE